jgi:hypothetical protein
MEQDNGCLWYVEVDGFMVSCCVKAEEFRGHESGPLGNLTT